MIGGLGTGMLPANTPHTKAAAARPPARQRVRMLTTREQQHRGPSCMSHADPAQAGPTSVEVAVLGGEDFIYSQMSGVSEELFKGDRLGVFADIASVDFRQTELRSLAHLPEHFSPPERFLERVALHYAKNILVSQGAVTGQVPLILGIWGPKGNGKSFNLELCCRVMGIQPVMLSAGELEDELAGEPGRRLRERYRFAVQHASRSGQPTCLIINDLDQGLGHFTNTDQTVNTQNLSGTLMALCDDPCLVSTGQQWEAASRAFSRVPIFVTANSLSVMYSPLVRDGRMDKFFWDPNGAERRQLLASMFDDLSDEQAATLAGAFPRQPLDFFESVKSRLSDAAVRAWLGGTSPEGMGAALLGDELMHAKDPGAWRSWRRVGPAMPLSLEAALRAATELAREQQHVMDSNLVREYYKNLDTEPAQQQQLAGRSGRPKPLPPPPPPPVIMSEEMAAYYKYMASISVPGSVQPERSEAAEEEENAARQRAELEAQAAEEAAAASRGWRTVTPDWLAGALRQKKGSVVVLDARSERECEWGKIKAAVNVPFVLTAGSSLNPTTRPNPDFRRLTTALLPDRSVTLVVYGSSSEAQAGKPGAAGPSPKGVFVSKALALSGDEDFVTMAMQELVAAGYSNLRQLAGGFKAWDLDYRPDGRRREKGNWADRSSGDLEWWTASN